MFNAPKSSSSSFDDARHSGSPAPTIIARGVRVEGQFISEGDVLIEGEVHGTLSTAGTLTVGPEAKVKAEIKAGEAIVSGSIEGNVTIARRLELKSTSNIVGDVSAETIAVEAGASLTGRVVIGTKRPSETKVSSRKEALAVAA